VPVACTCLVSALSAARRALQFGHLIPCPEGALGLSLGFQPFNQVETPGTIHPGDAP
jgi:hypothetical protein